VNNLYKQQGSFLYKCLKKYCPKNCPFRKEKDNSDKSETSSILTKKPVSIMSVVKSSNLKRVSFSSCSTEGRSTSILNSSISEGFSNISWSQNHNKPLFESSRISIHDPTNIWFKNLTLNPRRVITFGMIRNFLKEKRKIQIFNASLLTLESKSFHVRSIIHLLAFFLIFNVQTQINLAKQFIQNGMDPNFSYLDIIPSPTATADSRLHLFIYAFFPIILSL
jgi:uncharacterized membrane protein YraQ (UPF0718 family)